jgi:hypothetical protein
MLDGLVGCESHALHLCRTSDRAILVVHIGAFPQCIDAHSRPDVCVVFNRITAFYSHFIANFTANQGSQYVPWMSQVHMLPSA